MSGIAQFSQVLTSQKKAGTSLSNFTTAQSILVPEDLYTLPANALRVGSKLRVRAAGGLSNIVTTPGTITLTFKLGAVAVWSSGAIQMNATAHTLLPWWLDLDMHVRAEGSGTSANILAMGKLCGIQFTLTAGQTDPANTPGAYMVPATAPAVGTGFDSTVANLCDFHAAFSIANAGNAIQLQSYDLTHLWS
jgi:hypothetical protein